MRKVLFSILFILVSVMAYPQSSKVLLTIGEKSMTATLADNEATAELKALLASGPIMVNMSDYGGFEKVGALPRSFTTSNSQITTSPGDIMLYQGDKIVIFYGSNSWSYTSLGRIDNADSDNIRQFLGNGDIVLTISLDTTTEIADFIADDQDQNIFDLQGNRLYGKSTLKPGVYIVGGKKRIIRG